MSCPGTLTVLRDKCYFGTCAFYNGYTSLGVLSSDITVYGHEGADFNRGFTALEDPPVTGNVDLLGRISLTDVIALQKHLVNEKPFIAAQLALADLNADGRVDVIDLTLLKQTLTH